MARTRHQEVGADWSCPLCTLLNPADDDRCAACDNARPPAHLLRNSQPPDPPTAATTASEVHYVYRPSTGVFFSSLPSQNSDSVAATTWRQEPRLVVNRRRGNWRRKTTTVPVTKLQNGHIETGTIDQNSDSTGTERTQRQEEKVADAVQRRVEAVLPMVASEEKQEEQEEEEEEDTGMDVEEPCFNLLGSGAAIFAAPVVSGAVEDQCATDKTKSRDGSEEIDADDDVVVVSSPPRYPGFMPASKVHIEEPQIEQKLANAGLNLSDSDEEDKEPKQLRRRSQEKNDSWEDKWVCQICASLNDQTVTECLSCMCKRYGNTTHTEEPTTGSTLRWACHICTNLNPPDVTDCLMCLSTRKMGAGTSNGSSKRWKCSLCAIFNDPETTQCEVCDRVRDDKPIQAVGKSRECPVCTNINSAGSTRCEICDTALPTDEPPEDHFVDLSSSPPGGKSSYTVDDDLENPYADLSQYDYGAPNEIADADPDIEDISDNERPSMSLTNPRPPKVRTELKEFEHFVCMEDLHEDYRCRINYSKMFAGQRSRKSYADRLAERKAQSRKRKRDAARKEAGQASSPAPRGGKAAKGGKKRKSPAAPRRASAGGAKAPKEKRSKRNGASARRASSATKYSPGINHYDDSAAELGEDLSTMAWEGVGSAGYL